MEHCISTEIEKSIKLVHFVKECPDCSDFPRDQVCGIHPDGEGFRVRTFKNECELEKYNCEVKENFTITDYFICSNNANAEANERDNNKEKFQNMFKKHKDSANETTNDDKLHTMIEENTVNNTNKFKNLMILHGPMSLGANINKSFADFFKLTHSYGIPMQRLKLNFNDTTRRNIIKNLGPLKLFKPRYIIPKEIKEDHWHLPTINTCFHKCPKKCPDVYQPVCGLKGDHSRWPNIFFKNHCFLDAAQCKLFWSTPNDTLAGPPSMS
ncbi:uncharacterized protein LOC111362250 isoform X2 [Spodoptera litura]|uniref:Uncharacterized protein LOC111362250 isoform X2 n=1 Tax=Spodoptera litura TaxID=69820 RepID=A0A9J7EPD0_SPOLT|nr:uncharacterized protein LOC111362250 isoform X2 [Spodoptera litura]